MDGLREDYFKEIMELTQEANEAFLNGAVLTPLELAHKIKKIAAQLAWELNDLRLNMPREILDAAEAGYQERKGK